MIRFHKPLLEELSFRHQLLSDEQTTAYNSRYRGRGYGTQGLQLLCEQGRRDGLEALYDDIADDNPSLFLFLKNGFERVRDTEEGILVKKVL